MLRSVAQTMYRSVAKKRGWHAWSASTSRVLRAQYREILVVDDRVPGDAYCELPVRHRRAMTRSPRLQAVDPRERRAVRRAVARDVRQLALAGHERLPVEARPALERTRRRAVDDDHVEAEVRDRDAPDRAALGGAAMPAARGQRARRSRVPPPSRFRRRRARLLVRRGSVSTSSFARDGPCCSPCV